MNLKQPDKNTKLALILTGGGARAAYQVGVLKAIAELTPRDASNPFSIIVGTSAGAINSVALAIYGHKFCDAVLRLQRIWRNFHVGQVFRSDLFGILKSGAHWLAGALLGGLGKYNPASFLDRTPLRYLLEAYLPCQQINDSIQQGVIESIGITASAYGDGRSVVFYQSAEKIEPWERSRRVGRPDTITIDHLMASSAIPFVFAAERVGDDYYGDGSIRQIAPLSPAIHMGADRVLVIGVSKRRDIKEEHKKIPQYPSLAQVGSHILNSIFIDSLETDLERLRRVNKTIELIPSHHAVENNVSLRPIDVLVVSPSEDLQEISYKYVQCLPLTVRFFLRGIGAMDNKSSSLVSFLLFEKEYCRELINLGYKDAMLRKDELQEFLNIDKATAASCKCE